jgi:hypothetical protein
MGKILKITLISIVAIFLISFIWFDFFFWQGNTKNFEDALNKAANESDVIIIFNSGGFGTVHLERAWDFKPIVYGTQGSITNLNYKVSVIPYYRTEESWLGKAAYVKEVLFNFPKESKYLANKLQEFSAAHPDKTILLEGLSNGAAFVTATMEKIKCCNSKILAMEFGPPFWVKQVDNPNILIFNNGQKDALSNGRVFDLLYSVGKAPLIMIYTKIIGKPISFPEAMNVPGHQYTWQEVEPAVSGFLQEKIN